MPCSRTLVLNADHLDWYGQVLIWPRRVEVIPHPNRPRSTHSRWPERRITRLIGEIQRDPFSGIGKPDPLKGDLSGYWSRRIDDEHRLVYRADDQEVKILKARYH